MNIDWFRFDPPRKHPEPTSNDESKVCWPEPIDSHPRMRYAALALPPSVSEKIFGNGAYTDPRDGTNYTYITNEMSMPAYQLVMIYKHRWDTEKVFYQLKSKMEERKSWASTPTAQIHQAIFECLTHQV